MTCPMCAVAWAVGAVPALLILLQEPAAKGPGPFPLWGSSLHTATQAAFLSRPANRDDNLQLRPDNAPVGIAVKWNASVCTGPRDYCCHCCALGHRDSQLPVTTRQRVLLTGSCHPHSHVGWGVWPKGFYITSNAVSKSKNEWFVTLWDPPHLPYKTSTSGEHKIYNNTLVISLPDPDTAEQAHNRVC